jgi:hypothetical protein
MYSGKERDSTLAFASKFFIDSKPQEKLIALLFGTARAAYTLTIGQSNCPNYQVEIFQLHESRVRC